MSCGWRVEIPLDSLLGHFVLDFPSVPTIETVTQLSVGANEVGAIVGLESPRFTSSGDHPPVCHNVGVRLQGVGHLNVDRSRHQTGEQTTVSVLRLAKTFHLQWPKIINANV